MTHKRAISAVKEVFEDRLQEKTSWGRNEVKTILDEAIATVYIGMADNLNSLEGSILKERTVTKERYSPKGKVPKRALNKLKRKRGLNDE